MKSEKFIEWDDSFKKGVSVVKIHPAKVEIQSYGRGSSINLGMFNDEYETICLSEGFNVAPKFIDKGIHKANRIWEHYTYNVLPGAIRFLGCK